MTDLAKTAADAWDCLPDAKLELQNSGENATFRCAAGPRGKPVLIRVHGHAYNSIDEVRSELALLHHLVTLALPVPTPVRAGRGDWALEVEHPDAADVPPPFDRRVVSVLDWIDGEPARRVLSRSPDRRERYHRQAGSLMARVHGALRPFEPPAGFTRRTWDRRALLQTTAFAGDMATLWRLIPAKLVGPLREQMAWAGGQVDAAFADEPPQLLHGRPHLANMIQQPDCSLAAIDFDDVGYGPRLYDIAACVATPEEVTDETVAAYHADVRAVAAGYAEVADPPHPLPDLTNERWRGLAAARELSMVLWVASRAAVRRDWRPYVETHSAKALAFVQRLRGSE